MEILKVEHVSKRFGENRVLEDIGLSLHKGELVSLLGVSGAGKTTLMRVLTTALKPTAGEVTLNGIPYSESNYNRIRSRIGYLPQEIDLYPNLTVQECCSRIGRWWIMWRCR